MHVYMYLICLHVYAYMYIFTPVNKCARAYTNIHSLYVMVYSYMQMHTLTHEHASSNAPPHTKVKPIDRNVLCTLAGMVSHNSFV